MKLRSESSAITAGIDSCTNNSPPGKLPVKESLSSRVSCRSRDEAIMQLEEFDGSDPSDCSELQEVSPNDMKSASGHHSGREARQHGCLGKVKSSNEEETKGSDPLNLLRVLKKVLLVSSS